MEAWHGLGRVNSALRGRNPWPGETFSEFPQHGIKERVQEALKPVATLQAWRQEWEGEDFRARLMQRHVKRLNEMLRRAHEEQRKLENENESLYFQLTLMKQAQRPASSKVHHSHNPPAGPPNFGLGLALSSDMPLGSTAAWEGGSFRVRRDDDWVTLSSISPPTNDALASHSSTPSRFKVRVVPVSEEPSSQTLGGAGAAASAAAAETSFSQRGSAAAMHVEVTRAGRLLERSGKLLESAARLLPPEADEPLVA